MTDRDMIRGFARREDGGGTVFSLFIFVTLAMLLGLMLDGTNAWRNRTLLTSVADIAAHGGAVALATGRSEVEVAAEAERLVEANLATGFFGAVMEAESDVLLMHYNAEDRVFEATGPKNAVIVRVGRTEERGNPVGTFLLQFAGIDLWNVSAESAAVFRTAAQCNATDGIYAGGKVTLTSQNDIGAGFCIHSQDKVWLPQRNTFAEGSYVSMPDLDDCGNKCSSDANPGLVEGESAIEMFYTNFPNFAATTLASYDAFRSFGMTREKLAAFGGVSEETAVASRQYLRDAGVVVSPSANMGDVVSLSHAEFHGLEELPAGFVYDIQCPSTGGGGKSKLTFNATTARMSRAVVTTNCALEFADGASVIGSTVISVRESANAAVTASAGAVVADPTGTCDAGNRSTIMSVSDVSVPAKFVMSNVTIITGGDISIASASAKAASSTGVALYASGEVHIASQHTFRSCENDDAGLIPDLRSLRLVLPPRLEDHMAEVN